MGASFGPYLLLTKKYRAHRQVGRPTSLGGFCAVLSSEASLLVVGRFDRFNVDPGDGHMCFLAECPDRLLRRPAAPVLYLP